VSNPITSGFAKSSGSATKGEPVPEPPKSE
jgi:hypothetical protein